MTDLNWPSAFAIVGICVAACAALCVMVWVTTRGDR